MKSRKEIVHNQNYFERSNILDMHIERSEIVFCLLKTHITDP
jgi:hypothetical protein